MRHRKERIMAQMVKDHPKKDLEETFHHQQDVVYLDPILGLGENLVENKSNLKKQ